MSALLALNKHDYRRDSLVLHGWPVQTAGAAPTQNNFHGRQFRSAAGDGRSTRRQG